MVLTEALNLVQNNGILIDIINPLVIKVVFHTTLWKVITILQKSNISHTNVIYVRHGIHLNLRHSHILYSPVRYPYVTLVTLIFLNIAFGDLNDHLWLPWRNVVLNVCFAHMLRPMCGSHDVNSASQTQHYKTTHRLHSEVIDRLDDCIT